MEVQPELSLGVSSAGFAAVKSSRSSSSESDGSSGWCGKKRKHFAWEWEEAVPHVELQLGDDPLPLDWEQCLDLHSGRMYYLNRKTMKKSWVRPMSAEEQCTLNLELHIATAAPSTFDGKAIPVACNNKGTSDSVTSGDPMVAVPCVNCHLLVMLCKSSPACPNCKFLQPPVRAVTPQTPHRLDAVKPLVTLSLLH